MSYHCLYKYRKKSYNSIHYINIERNTRRKLKNKKLKLLIYSQREKIRSYLWKSKGKRTEHLNKSKKKIVS